MIWLAPRAAQVAIVCLLCGVLSLAAAPPKTEIVEYPSGAETVRGFLALPGMPGRHAAILVIHGDAGLNEWVQEQARKFAAQGYVALAVDLYRGRVAADDEEAHELARGLPDDRALRDVEAAFTYLAARKDVSSARIGVIGRQSGGWFALELAIPKLQRILRYSLARWMRAENRRIAGRQNIDGVRCHGRHRMRNRQHHADDAPRRTLDDA